MASQQVFKVANIHGTSARFKQYARKLNKKSHADLVCVLDELRNGTLAPGRHLEKMSGYERYYSVRLNLKQRLVFRLELDQTIRLVAVGNHDQTYRYFNP